ncbi:hypothetical protein HOG98_00225 [bacterium]|jgi:phosphoglucomutase|nr:hypothetical protein [bacterium]
MIKIKHPIIFGTSGHRGIQGDSFTVEHVVSITQAVCDIIKETESDHTLCLGYDPRTGNSPTLQMGSYTQAIASVCAKNKVNIQIFDHVTPTPVVSWYIKNNRCSGGFILTASHNPKEYNGLKYNIKNGAPAPKHVTDKIESLANSLYNPGSTHSCEIKESDKQYISFFDQDDLFVDSVLSEIHRSGLSIKKTVPFCVDVKHGTTGSIWAKFANSLKSPFHMLHNEPLSDFANIEPNPTKISSLSTLKESIALHGASLGVSNDPDGDRHIILDETGSHLTPEESSVIILDFLYEKGMPIHGVASTVASSNILQSFCSKNNISYHQTGVGFKYFSPFFDEAFKNQEFVAGIESSGGFSTSFHSFDKCGFLPAIYILHILSQTNTPLSVLRNNVKNKYGNYFFAETEVSFKQSDKPLIIDKLSSISSTELNQFFETPVKNINQTDGLRINFENSSWVLIRLSGTEPIGRIYSESIDKNIGSTVLEESKQFFYKLV